MIHLIRLRFSEKALQNFVAAHKSVLNFKQFMKDPNYQRRPVVAMSSTRRLVPVVARDGRKPTVMILPRVVPVPRIIPAPVPEPVVTETASETPETPESPAEEFGVHPPPADELDPSGAA